MKRFFGLLCFVGLLHTVSFGQGFQLEVKLDNYTEDVLYLGYHFGDKQYMRDSSITKNAEGAFVFKADTLIDPGMYLILMAPEKRHFQFLIDDVQQFSIRANAEDIENTIVFKGCAQNEIFYNYMRYLTQMRMEVESIRERLESSTDDAEKERIQEILLEKNKDVKRFQEGIVNKNPKHLLSIIIKANWEIESPEFEGTEEEVMYAKFYYIRDHFFDNMDMQDHRLVRTPVLFPRVDAYVNKYHAVVPDSSIVAVDKVLKLLEGNEPGFRFFLSYFLNTYSKSKYVGMDAVYVHLVDNYYAKGMAPWVQDENLEKIVKEATKLKPILVGKKAPELKMTDKDGKLISLHGLDAEFTVLIFWAPDCGHCKKAMPDVDKFAANFKSKGVEVYAVCSKLGDVQECWDMIDNKKMVNMVNVVDPRYQTRFKDVYNVVTTPKIYVLDKDKTIISKNIGTEQLEEIMTRFTEELKG